MQEFIVSSISAGFGPGAVLLLTVDQIARRAHAVRELRDDERSALELGADSEDLGAIVVERSVKFKRGERVTVIEAGSINKALFQPLALAGTEEADDTLKSVGQKRARSRKVAKEREEKAAATERRRSNRKRATKTARKPRKRATQPAGMESDHKAADKE